MCGKQVTTKRCHVQYLFYIAPLLLLFIISTQSSVVAAIKSPSIISFINKNNKISSNSNNNIMAPKKNNAAAASAASAAESSSVLRELKDTIQSQAAEIERLKKAALPKVIPSGGHAHGASASDSAEILDYKEKSAISIATERVGWLAVFLLSLSFTALIMNGFEHTLSKQIELAYFVPLMAGHGGNTGGQAVGTVLSALSAGVITRQDAWKVVGKEAMSGLVMGVILGAAVGPISHYVMGISKHVATVVSVTFPFLSLIASLLGSSLPFVCVWLGLDPAVIAAPAMTSFVDVAGLLCYFLLANKIFQMFGLEL